MPLSKVASFIEIGGNEFDAMFGAKVLKQLSGIRHRGAEGFWIRADAEEADL